MSEGWDTERIIICPSCLESREDFDFPVCPVCGTEFEVFDPAEDYTWEVIYTTNTEIDALMCRDRLLMAGIPANILSQLDTSRMLTVGELAIIKVLVPKSLMISAKKILAD
jgi:hypothetical protein